MSAPVSTELAQPQCSLLAFRNSRGTVVQKTGWKSWWLETLQKNTGGLKLTILFWWLQGTLKTIGGPHVLHWWPQDFSPEKHLAPAVALH